MPGAIAVACGGLRPMTGPMLASPTIAVVIPVYNCAQYIEDALRSIEAQARAPERVIVVDDGSTDGSADVLARFAVHSELPLVIVTQQNRGAAAARNAGVAQCDEDLIAFLDGDDTLYPPFLERAADVLARHSELLAWFADRDVVDADGKFIRRDLDHPSFRAIRAERLSDGVSVFAENPFVALLPGSVIPMSVVVRRSAIREVGGLDETMRVAEDKLFLMHLAKLGEFGFSDEPLGTWRRHDSNASGASHAFRMAFYDDLALEKLEQNAARLNLTDDELRAIKLQRRRNSAGLLYTASSEAHPDFFRITSKLVKEGRMSWAAVSKACLRYGWRRLTHPQGLSSEGRQ